MSLEEFSLVLSFVALARPSPQPTTKAGSLARPLLCTGGGVHPRLVEGPPQMQ